jgi:hypothetical protein
LEYCVTIFVSLNVSFDFPSVFPLAHWMFRNAFNFCIPVIFPSSFCFTFSFTSLWLRRTLDMISIFLRLALWCNIWSFLENGFLLLKRMCILLLLERIFCICLLGLFGSKCTLNSVYLFISCWAPWLILQFSYYEQSCYKHGQVTLLCIDLDSFGYMPKSGMSGL